MMMNNIRKIRLARGLSMAALAEKIDPPTDASQILRLEKGDRRLTDVWIEKISEALSCTKAEILGEEAPQHYVMEAEPAQYKISGGTPKLNTDKMYEAYEAGSSTYQLMYNKVPNPDQKKLIATKMVEIAAQQNRPFINGSLARYVIEMLEDEGKL